MTQTERSEVAIREWEEADAAPLAGKANDRRIWLGLRDAFPHPHGLEDAHRFIAMARGMSPRTFFAILVEGEIAGGIGYSLRTDVERVGAEVGYWVAPEFWGRGVATRALHLLTDHAFQTHAELLRLYAVPYASNVASPRVLEKAGFQREGVLRQSCIKDGKVYDQLMYALLRAEWAQRTPARNVYSAK